MKISYNWIKQYIDTDLSYQEVSEILTNTGLEVEGIEKFQSIKGGLEGLVIGEVKTCEAHPNSDHLSITTVDVGGNDLLPIVCGAPNVRAGQKVVVATVGTILYDGDESFKIKKAKMRGEPSMGMICAEDEIGIGTSHDGIMVLDNDVEVGTQAKDYFNIENDIIFEIGLTPNRIDGASHYGVARDLAAYLNQYQKVALKKPVVDNFKIDNNDNFIDVEIENKNACHRYTGITLSELEIKESPAWLQNRLKSIGLKPINNVVDATNFVLHETGQPLHAFDADKIKGKKIIVKTLKEGTKFTTLDKVERKLSSNDLMICNEEEGMCIAGVFGGIESGVTENTKNIFLESACFDSVFIRKTSRRHLLQTDASFRFERGADPNITVYALKRAALLINELAGGKISSNIVDVYPKPIEDYNVIVSYNNIDRLIGKKIEKEAIKNILASLDIKIVAEDEKTLNLEVPTYRVDVRREADVIEEILRIYGYNNIEISGQVKSTISYSEKPDKNTVTNLTSNLLSSIGFNEIMSNSLTKSSYYENLKSYDKDELVSILNPLSSDLNCMRQTLLFGGLEAIAFNINRKNPDLKFYEFGNCYSINKKNQDENPIKKYNEGFHLSLFVTGLKQQANWIIKAEPSNFYLLKSYVENIMHRLGIDINSVDINELNSDILNYGLHYTHNQNNNKTPFVSFGSVNKKILKAFDIKTDVFYADFDWDAVLKILKTKKVSYTEIAKYPEVKRDLALLLDKKIRFEQIKTLAFNTEKKLLKKISLFDVYEGNKIGEDKKSYAISFILQDPFKTLTDKQIDKIMNKFIKVFDNELGAKIR
ncbi:MAG: phenylalanine--tRNA ligase subunit beta [Bacteroidetes bacterium]|nr:MAG: phenylalanine--tRNA ligase subunit beta [Bacteroidota bacterium]